MIAFSFLAGQITVVISWILFRTIVFIKNKYLSWKRELVQLLFLINLLVICRVTFHPFSKVDGQVQPLIFDVATAWPFRINLLPFVHLLDYESKRELLLNLIGNCALFIPTGIVTPLTYKTIDGFKKVTLTGFMISLIIELIQLPFAVRCSDVDDLFLNTLGCMIGFGILSLCRLGKRTGK